MIYISYFENLTDKLHKLIVLVLKRSLGSLKFSKRNLILGLTSWRSKVRVTMSPYFVNVFRRIKKEGLRPPQTPTQLFLNRPGTFTRLFF